MRGCRFVKRDFVNMKSSAVDFIGLSRCSRRPPPTKITPARVRRAHGERAARRGSSAALSARCVRSAQTAAFSQPVGGVCRHAPSLGPVHTACASLQREGIRAVYSPSNPDPLGSQLIPPCVRVCVCVNVYARLTSTLSRPL